MTINDLGNDAGCLESVSGENGRVRCMAFVQVFVFGVKPISSNRHCFGTFMAETQIL